MIFVDSGVFCVDFSAILEPQKRQKPIQGVRELSPARKFAPRWGEGVKPCTKKAMIAKSLIRSLGIDEAAYFALQNHWEDVLAHMPKGVPSRRAAPRVVHVRAD